MNTPNLIYNLCFPNFRLKRLKLFMEKCAPGPSGKILDVGGSEYFWRLAEKSGIQFNNITILNLHKAPSNLNKRFKWIIADGRKMPFADMSYDHVFCNSVIEHLGSIESMKTLAMEIRRVAPSYFVQTPARGFFLEPHSLTPFLHWLPEKAYSSIKQKSSLRHILFREKNDPVSSLNDIRLLNKEELTGIFPGSTIISEKWLGLTKSLIAYGHRSHNSTRN